MLKTIHGIVDDQGNIKLSEPIKLAAHQQVLVTVLENDEEYINGIPVTMLLSEKALGEYWNRPEEDEAWKDFQHKAK